MGITLRDAEIFKLGGDEGSGPVLPGRDGNLEDVSEELED